jgi:hypothetical protein
MDVGQEDRAMPERDRLGGFGRDRQRGSRRGRNGVDSRNGDECKLRAI